MGLVKSAAVSEPQLPEGSTWGSRAAVGIQGEPGEHVAPWAACRCARWVADVTVMGTAVLGGVLPARAHTGAPGTLLGAAVLGVEASSPTAGPGGTPRCPLCPLLPGMLPRLQTAKPEQVSAAGRAWAQSRPEPTPAPALRWEPGRVALPLRASLSSSLKWVAGARHRRLAHEVRGTCQPMRRERWLSPSPAPSPSWKAAPGPDAPGSPPAPDL